MASCSPDQRLLYKIAAQQAVAADTLRFGRFAPFAPRAAEPQAVRRKNAK